MLNGVDWAGIAATIAAIGAIVTAVLTFLQNKPLNATHAAAVDTNQKVTTSNGTSLAEVVEQAAAVVNNEAPPTKPDATA